jgi:hypothetical protein
MKSLYQCKICGKQLNSRTTLWRHKKKCVEPNVQLEVAPAVAEPCPPVKYNTALQEAIALCALLREKQKETLRILGCESI